MHVRPDTDFKRVSDLLNAVRGGIHVDAAPSVRIFAAVEPVDARKSFDGLAAVVRDSLGGDPMTGHMFFFLNRRGDMAQIYSGIAQDLW